MSKIIATDNLKTQNWEVVFENLSPNYADLYIGFTDEAPIIEFNNLRFGFELRQDGTVLQYGVYPPSGVRYTQTDQLYLVSTRLKFEVDNHYDLYLWAQNGDISFEKTESFVAPRPPKHFDSWIWNEEVKGWEPPVSHPYPERDDLLFEWNEETQTWAEVTE